ncbi:hypothetical protein GCM10023189_07980 [Nibrella saemangeumensis]|uniref:DUF433 domain-containing protein n=1 Tax=Nibrella saemangeumensis TaxID=1084526 RepID=A0ABP8ME73_9BACT
MKLKHIHSDPEILGGKPCIKGTRISVELILETIANGASITDIVQEFPKLSPEAVQEAVLYAVSVLRDEIVIEVKSVA